jgi:hypothetical protein
MARTGSFARIAGFAAAALASVLLAGGSFHGTAGSTVRLASACPGSLMWDAVTNSCH